ncbi:MAG: hypothetical protein ACRD5H_10825 [Nitrososphaerales archaeon]
MVIEVIEINVAALNYDEESRIIQNALREMEAMVHDKDQFSIGDPQFTFGWYFFTLSVSKNLAVKLMNLLGNEFLSVKGKTFENKFLNYLATRLKQVGCDVHLNLKAEMETSKFGLF